LQTLLLIGATTMIAACGGGGSSSGGGATPAVRTWGTAELIETDNAGNARDPQIAYDLSGNAIAVWHQADGTRVSIYANRFE